MDSIAIFAGVCLIFASIIIVKLLRSQKKRVNEVQGNTQISLNKLKEIEIGLEKLVDKVNTQTKQLNQVLDISVELREWAEELKDPVIFKEIQQFTDRLVAITLDTENKPKAFPGFAHPHWVRGPKIRVEDEEDEKVPLPDDKDYEMKGNKPKKEANDRTWEHPEVKGVRIAAVDDTRSCPVVSICTNQKKCILGDGEGIPFVQMVLRDLTGVGPEFVCKSFVS